MYMMAGARADGAILSSAVAFNPCWQDGLTNGSGNPPRRRQAMVEVLFPTGPKSIFRSAMVQQFTRLTGSRVAGYEATLCLAFSAENLRLRQWIIIPSSSVRMLD
jgi:hypothetical protein